MKKIVLNIKKARTRRSLVLFLMMDVFGRNIY